MVGIRIDSLYFSGLFTFPTIDMCYIYNHKMLLFIILEKNVHFYRLHFTIVS